MKTDIYQRITDTIVGQLEQGVRPWIKPWNAEHAAGRITRPLRACGQPYQGINVLALWASATAQGFCAPIWMTFKQAKELGGSVRKGEKGSPVVYASTLSRTETDESTGEESERQIPYMKGYTVFNVEQVEGLPAPFYAIAEAVQSTVERIEGAERYFSRTGAVVRHGGDQASYNVAADIVRMPPIEAFRDAESYYATLAHEMTHWTRHPSRLGRDFGRKRWGDEGYAMEELVAELGAAFVCADLELATEPRDEHAAYIASWLKTLKNDNRAIFAAAAHAQRAANHLNALQSATQAQQAA